MVALSITAVFGILFGVQHYRTLAEAQEEEAPFLSLALLQEHAQQGITAGEDTKEVPMQIYVNTPALLRQDVVVDSALLETPHVLTLPIRIVEPSDEQSTFHIRISLNDTVVRELVSTELSTKWQNIEIAVPRALLQSGENTIILGSEDILPSSAYSVYALSPGAEGQTSCHSADGGESWNRADPAPKSNQDGTGFKYNIQLAALPDESSVDPAFQYLLDEERFSLLSCPTSYATNRIGPYYLDPENTEQLRKLQVLVPRSGTDYEKAMQIMSFLSTALSNPRKTNSGSRAYNILIENGGAWCSGNAFTFVALAALSGIDARVVTLNYTLTDGSLVGHVVPEAWIDGQWVLFDPFSNATFQRNGKRYSVGKLAREREELSSTPLASFTNLNLTIGDRENDRVLGDVVTTTFDGAAPVRFLDFFNEDAWIQCGNDQIPYYETHARPRA